MKYKILPYNVYTIPIIMLSAIGMAASCYLAVSHYRNYTDIAYSSFCAISQAINCDTVSQSSWSFMLGIPVAMWGILAYLLFFLISLPAQKKTAEYSYLWDLLFIIALVFCVFDIYFGYIAVVKIKAYCVVCILTYAVSLALLFSTWIVRRRFNQESLTAGLKKSLQYLRKERILSGSLLVLCLFFLSLKIILPNYWHFEYPPISKEVHQGITEDGHHWIGAEQPLMTINEFSDYQCFQCSKMHLMIRLLVHEHPDKIRLVHYHYPMDEKFNTVLVKDPFHTGSGALALIAIAAGRQNKFWQANDALYSIARQGVTEFNIVKFATKLGVDIEKFREDMSSYSALKELEADIRKGLKNNIIGTPTFIIGDQVYPSQIPPKLLESVLRD